MAITLVQSKGAAANSGSTATVSGLTPTTAGNLLVLLVSAAKNPGQVTFVPPGGWQQAGTTLHDDVFVSISTGLFYYPNCPAGLTSISVTLSSAPSAWHLYVLEFSGVATASPLDATAAREQDHTTTPSSGAITTTAAGDLLLGWSEMDDNNGVYTLSQPAGWTALTQLDDANVWTTTYPAYKIAGAAGSENYQPTKSASVPDGTFTIAAFLAAAAGGGTVNGIGVSDGVGAGQATGATLMPAQSTGAGVGAGQAQATVAVAGAVSQGAGAGQATGATLQLAGVSAGHADDYERAGAVVSPAGAVSAGVGHGQAVIPSNIVPGTVTLANAPAATATLSDQLAAKATLGDALAGTVVLSDS